MWFSLSASMYLFHVMIFPHTFITDPWNSCINRFYMKIKWNTFCVILAIESEGWGLQLSQVPRSVPLPMPSPKVLMALFFRSSFSNWDQWNIYTFWLVKLASGDFERKTSGKEGTGQSGCKKKKKKDKRIPKMGTWQWLKFDIKVNDALNTITNMFKV